MNSSRIGDRNLLSKVMTADDAAELVDPGSTVGISGFNGLGYPKTVPTALAGRSACRSLGYTKHSQ
nr:hypothetical protein [Bradyrhizobium sp. CCBAU 45384]